MIAAALKGADAASRCDRLNRAARLCSECSVVRTVDFSYCLVGNSAMKVLMSGLNSSVVHLYVAGNSLRAAVVHCSMLPTSFILIRTVCQASSLNGALKKMHFLQTLNLRDNCLGESLLIWLSQAIVSKIAWLH